MDHFAKLFACQFQDTSLNVRRGGGLDPDSCCCQFCPGVVIGHYIVLHAHAHVAWCRKNDLAAHDVIASGQRLFNFFNLYIWIKSDYG